MSTIWANEGGGGGKGIYSRRVFGLWLKGWSLIHGREVIGTWALIWGDMVHLRRTLPLTSLSFCHTMRFLRRKKSLRNRTMLEKDCPLKYNVVLCVLLFYFGYVCLFLFSRVSTVVFHIFTLFVFLQVVRSSGALEYKDKLITAIKGTIHLKCKEAATLGATVSGFYMIIKYNVSN